MRSIRDSVSNVSGAIMDSFYSGPGILNMLLQRLILSIPLDVLEKVTSRFKNS